MPRLVKLSREQHADVARLLCGAMEDIMAALNIAGPAMGAAKLDLGLKAYRILDVRLVMHLQDAWDDAFGLEGNPYRAAIRAADDRSFARKGLRNPWPAEPAQ